MKLFRLLFDPHGAISRPTFAITAIALTAIKISGDLALARIFFNHSWEPKEYLFLRSAFLFKNTSDWNFGVAMLLWAAPFTWLGLCLLTKRLRSAQAPIPLVILFFVPVAKLFLFAILCALPEREETTERGSISQTTRKWAPERFTCASWKRSSAKRKRIQPPAPNVQC